MCEVAQLDRPAGTEPDEARESSEQRGERRGVVLGAAPQLEAAHGRRRAGGEERRAAGLRHPELGQDAQALVSPQCREQPRGFGRWLGAHAELEAADVAGAPHEAIVGGHLGSQGGEQLFASARDLDRAVDGAALDAELHRDQLAARVAAALEHVADHREHGGVVGIDDELCEQRLDLVPAIGHATNLRDLRLGVNPTSALRCAPWRVGLSVRLGPSFACEKRSRGSARAQPASRCW